LRATSSIAGSAARKQRHQHRGMVELAIEMPALRARLDTLVESRAWAIAQEKAA
jgi:hypothetical protein